jgi:hypothetical protein
MLRMHGDEIVMVGNLAGRFAAGIKTGITPGALTV